METIDNSFEILMIDKNYTDLNPVLLGWEQCIPSHSFGPHIREYYLIHFISSGHGVFENQNGAQPVHPGQAFVIRPGEVTTYTADEKEPWHYIWIGFTGRLAALFDDAPDILKLQDCRLFPNMLRCGSLSRMREEFLAGQLFLLLADVFGETSTNPSGVGSYTERAANYIEKNYMRNLSVEKLAEDMNINRRYLSRIFKEDYGMSLKEYITDVKLRHAEALLQAGYSVTQTASMTGYADPVHFSKIFKKHRNITPAELRLQKGKG